MQNKKTRQALLNEQKGYIFEFLVSQQLTQLFGLSTEKFLQGIEVNYLNRLEQYQRDIYAQDKCLFGNLPSLAKKTAEYIFRKYKKFQVQSIKLCSREKSRGSADIILVLLDLDPLEISLKLCKNHSYINTKSAGVKSFFTNYFENAEDIQHSFNSLLFSSFEKLRFGLLESVGVDLSSHQFDQWLTLGNTTLPGELDASLRSLLSEYYFDSISALHQGLSDLMMNHQMQTQRCIVKLFGLPEIDNKNHIHIFCLHDGTQHYRFVNIVEMDNRDILKQKAEISPPSRGNAHFLIDYKTVVLQIRVKPMRDFTAPSMKVNCAIKFAKGQYEQ